MSNKLVERPSLGTKIGEQPIVKERQLAPGNLLLSPVFDLAKKSSKHPSLRSCCEAVDVAVLR
ncbi:MULTISPECIES: hypothetical protein [unclassified Devosia]|uniref:hypothetical protein n=1 Tax=unclassified Devosia TaxID=196773 RepID=UPI0020BEDA16|nr:MULTISPECIES: hypothetical protein [unclassified Devosia]